MNDDIKTVMKHFEQNGVNYQKLDSESILRMIFGLKNGSFESFFIVSQGPARSLEILTRFPVKVPCEKRYQVAELLNCVNQYTLIGHLHMDMDIGQITCKTSIMLGPDSVLDDGMIRHLVTANLVIADRHFPAVQKVIFGNIAPKDALNLPDADNEAGSEKETPSHFGGRLGKFFDGSSN